MRILVVLLVAACGAGQHPRPTDGSIGGLVRDKASGEPVAMADLRIRPQAGPREIAKTISAPDGLYAIDHLPAGRYELHGKFAGQPITIKNIPVSAGGATFVDVMFTLGSVEPILVDFGDPTQGLITYYASSHGARIEGVVSDAGTRESIAGAVVTAEGSDTLQTVTDDRGRYRFDSVIPGTYAVSAYYSVGGRGQIEVRRQDIAVQTAQGVIVPLWVEMEKQ